MKKTTALINDYIVTRAGMILSNLPGTQRRIDRLSGAGASSGDPVSALMSYLPGFIETGAVPVSTSLNAIEAMAGNSQPSRFDVWVNGTLGVFDGSSPNGIFGATSLGADYLVQPDLLVGGFIQMDTISQGSSPNADAISGSGWLAGPYVTGRLGEQLYFDILAAAGQSSNVVTPSVGGQDVFAGTRWLASASLQGQWQSENWTFSPRARISYFEETSAAYIDSFGVTIPSLTAGLGQVAVGPSISYRLTSTSDVEMTTGLRVEAVADMVRANGEFGFDNLNGRVEGTLDLGFVGGARLSLSGNYDGFGSNRSSMGASVRLSVPVN